MDCNNNCNPCSQIEPCTTPNCACPVLISSDCVNNVTEDLTCSNILKGQTLTEVLKQLDAFICTKFNSLADFLTIINVGTGAEVFKGANLLGKKQLRSLVASGLVTIDEGTDEITISIDEAALDAYIEANQLTYSADSVGTGAVVLKDSTVVGGNTQFNFKTLTSSDNSVIIVEGTDEIDLTIVAGDTADGSETIVTAGTNVSVTGIGTTGNPYIVNAATPNGSETKVTAGTNVTVTGTGTTGDPYIVNSASGGGGTVTSVAALTLGTSGTDLNSSVATGTTTPVITLNVPTASASNRGVLSTTDWSTFNGKAPLANPTFTGIPAAPTAAPGTNTTQIATTAFVDAAVIASSATSGNYVPTLGTHTGISTVNNLYATWIRVGNIVTVQMQFNITTVSPTVGRKVIFLSLPVPRVDTANRLVGSGVAEDGGVGFHSLQVELVGSNTTQAEVIFFNPNTSSSTYLAAVNFQYTI